MALRFCGLSVMPVVISAGVSSLESKFEKVPLTRPVTIAVRTLKIVRGHPKKP